MKIYSAISFEVLVAARDAAIRSTSCFLWFFLHTNDWFRKYMGTRLSRTILVLSNVEYPNFDWKIWLKESIHFCENLASFGWLLTTDCKLFEFKGQISEMTKNIMDYFGYLKKYISSLGSLGKNPRNDWIQPRLSEIFLILNYFE